MEMALSVCAALQRQKLERIIAPMLSEARRVLSMGDLVSAEMPLPEILGGEAIGAASAGYAVALTNHSMGGHNQFASQPPQMCPNGGIGRRASFRS